MKTISHTLLATCVVGLFALSSAQADVIPDQYIVSVKPGAKAANVLARHGLGAQHRYSTVFEGFCAKVPPGQLARLQADPEVASVTPDREVFAFKPGGGGGGGGGGGTTTQTIPAGVARIGATPGAVTQTGSDVGVAVVDTGIDLLHRDLGAVDGFSAYGGSAQDNNGHGTHVAGIIAARNNNFDVVGVAPGATVYAVKVLDASGKGSDASIIAGLDWVAANGGEITPPIRVVNMSLGRPGTLDDNPELRTAVQGVTGAGITVVVAAGNDCDMEVSQQVPATYPEVIAVGSTTAKDGTTAYPKLKILADTASYFTTDGAWDAEAGIGVTISAPGEEQENVAKGYRLSSVGILSLKVGGANGGTTRMAGTSMASPHVAGVAALLYQQRGTAMNPELVRACVAGGAMNTAAPLNSPTTCYSFDGDREGILSAPGALGYTPPTAP
jgi:subtilisin family serine protease